MAVTMCKVSEALGSVAFSVGICIGVSAMIPVHKGGQHPTSREGFSAPSLLVSDVAMLEMQVGSRGVDLAARLR